RGTTRAEGNPGSPGRRARRSGSPVSDLPDVGRLQPLRASRDLELDLISLAQALEALGLDGAVVDEDVLAALLGDEAESLRIVGPLPSSLCHARTLSSGSSAPVFSRRCGGVALQHWRANKNAARTGSRAACISVYGITDTEVTNPV